MCLLNFPSRLMVDRGNGRICVGQVLNKRALAPYVQRLQAIADAQNWLSLIEGSPQKKFVHRLTRFIFGCALLLPFLSVPPRINVRRASRQQDPGAGSQGACPFRRSGMQWNGHCCPTGRFHGADVLRQTALVVCLVRRRRFRDSDTGKRHTSSLTTSTLGAARLGERSLGAA